MLDPQRLYMVTNAAEENAHPIGRGPLRPVPALVRDDAQGRPLEYLIALDLRFDFYLDTPLCYLSVSIWSGRPLHSKHRRLSRANYLIIPAKPAHAASPDKDSRQKAYQDQENRTGSIITNLSRASATWPSWPTGRASA